LLQQVSAGAWKRRRTAQAFVHGCAGGHAPGDQDQLPQHGELTLIQPKPTKSSIRKSVYDWSTSSNVPMSAEVAECGHFFHGKLTDLKDLILPRLSN